MSPFRGHLPSYFLVQLAVALAASTVAPCAVAAPLALAEAERLALAAEPGAQSFVARAEALRETAVAAGQLPDPQLRVGLGNFPIESGGFSTEGMTHVSLGVRQAFPPGDTRRLQTGKTASRADEQQQLAEARRRDVLTAVRGEWLELYFQQNGEVIVADIRPLFVELLETSRSRFAVGQADQRDVLQAELQLSRLDDRLIEIQRQLATAQANLSEWIGVHARRPLPADLPRWQPLPPVEPLELMLAAHPAVRAADARIAARDAMLKLARERRKPGWAVDVAYSYRDGQLPTGTPRSDFVSVAVTMDLPLFRRNRQDREIAAAVGERRAAVAARGRLVRTLTSRLGSEYARWHDLARRIDVYRQRILPQTADHADAALAAYRSRTADFDQVLAARVAQLEARLSLLRLQVDRLRSHAELAGLVGVTP